MPYRYQTDLPHLQYMYNEIHESSRGFYAVLRIRIRMDPRHFGKLDSDPDPHQSVTLDPDRILIKVKSRIRFRIKMKRWKP